MRALQRGKLTTKRNTSLVARNTNGLSHYLRYLDTQTVLIHSYMEAMLAQMPIVRSLGYR